jgi:hypothetical protein
VAAIPVVQFSLLLLEKQAGKFPFRGLRRPGLFGILLQRGITIFGS